MMVVGQDQTEPFERFQGSVVDSVLSARWIASIKRQVTIYYLYSHHYCLQPRVQGLKNLWEVPPVIIIRY